MSNRSDPYGPVTRWRIDRAGIAAYLAQFPNGEIHVGTSLEGVAARGAAIDPALLGLAAGVVGFRRGQLYEVAPYEMEPFHFATRRVLFSVGAVRIEARRSGEQTVLSSVRGTERIRLGEAISPCISSSGCAGIDQLQITERFVATSHLSVDAHGSQSSVTVWPLDGSPPRHTTDPLPLPLP